MLQRSCWEKIIEIIHTAETSPLVIYGEAGTGKTSMVLSLLGLIEQSFLLINTEGPLLHERALQVLGEMPRDSYIVDAHDQQGVLYYLFRIPRKTRVIAIDSVNAPYRLQASEGTDKAIRLFALINAILKKYRERGLLVLLTAQVTLEGEPSGLEVLSRYSDVFLRLAKRDFGEVYHGEEIIGKYRIVGNGLVWLEC